MFPTVSPNLQNKIQANSGMKSVGWANVEKSGLDGFDSFVGLVEG